MQVSRGVTCRYALHVLLTRVPEVHGPVSNSRSTEGTRELFAPSRSWKSRKAEESQFCLVFFLSLVGSVFRSLRKTSGVQGMHPAPRGHELEAYLTCLLS